MGADTGYIEVQFFKHLDAEEWCDLLSSLEDTQFSLSQSENGLLEYLGYDQENEDTEWVISKLSSTELRTLILRKLKGAERIGFVLKMSVAPFHRVHLWNATGNVEGTTLYFNLPDEAERIGQTHLTNFNIYLPSIAEACFRVLQEFELRTSLYIDRL